VLAWLAGGKAGQGIAALEALAARQPPRRRRALSALGIEPAAAAPAAPAAPAGAADVVTLGDAWLGPAIKQGLIQPIPSAETYRWVPGGRAL
jgi:hypothetical protein